MGTELYKRAIAYDYGDQERNELMRTVWEPTPWMVDAYTGPTNEQRDREMRQWCHDQYGSESFPIHGMFGTWQRGGATIHGWTWYGFATEDQLNDFMERWPVPSGVAIPA